MATTVASGKSVRPNGASPSLSAWATILPSGRRSARAIRFLLIRKNTSTGTNAAACDTAVAAAAPAVPQPNSMTNT